MVILHEKRETYNESTSREESEKQVMKNSNRRKKTCGADFK